MSEINIPERHDYKAITPFRLFVKSNFPFIESTYEALDNYGLYCKVVEYLNQVIAEQNKVNTDMVTFTDFVTNYFENLDVQEEINNKLDEMAESGELYELIERFTTPITNALNSRISALSNQVNAMNSSPLVASSTSGMTNTNRIYVNTTDGKWYYYNGSAWVVGGTYQSTQGVDKTLTQSNTPPDSKIVGEKLQEKNFDIEYLSGYKIIQNPISYITNAGAGIVSNIGITGNTVTFTVSANQTTKGILSSTYPIKRGKTYTLLFDVDLSDNEHQIKFHYNGGNGTLNKNITGHDSIKSTFTRALTYQADGALLFFIDNNTENDITVSISNLILFEGTVENIVTLKDFNDKEIDAQLIEGRNYTTTNSSTNTSNIPLKGGNTYKIEVISMSNIVNFFSSTDTSVSVLRVTTPGTYYLTPSSDGYLSSFAFNAANFSLNANIYLLTFNDTMYVKTTGNDSNNGLSPDSALKTIQKAIDLGARNIIVERGKYYHQTIRLTGIGEELSIKPFGYSSYTDSVPDRPLIEIINGTELSNLSADSTYTSLLSQNFEGNNAWNKVFITHELVPSTPGNRGYNNAGLWQISGTEDFSKDKRVNPVLTIEECVQTVGTFFWDGTKVYVNPYNEEYDSFVAQDDVDYGIYLENLNKLDLQDVSVKFSKHSNYLIKNCMDIHLQNCISQYTNVINGFQMNNSNGLLENCQAYNSRDDGFGAQDYGVTTYLNCIGNYNDDDGISHHYGERAFIIGGEYGHNGKGGVASPTYGAYVNVYDVYTHHNARGIYATNSSDSHNYATRTCFVSNCLILNNTAGIEAGGTTTIIGWNNIFGNNTHKYFGNYVEYTNQQ